MEFARLAIDESYGNYSCKEVSNIDMCILGMFLATDVGCYWPSFKEWVLDDTQIETSSNVTHLKKDGNDMLLSDIYSMEKKPTKLRITLDQFVNLLDDWREKVCEAKPKEVIIKYENEQFIIETKDK
jgi:hypothetical protein